MSDKIFGENDGDPTESIPVVAIDKHGNESMPFIIKKSNHYKELL